MKKSIKIMFILFILIGAVFLLINNNESVNSITSALEKCAYTVFPSLFGFMIVTTVLFESGVCIYICVPLKFISIYIFRMNEEVLLAFLFSLVGGYPAGANIVLSLYEKGTITKKQAQWYCSCFYCGGPAFIFGLYGKSIGKYIYISVVIASFVITLIVNNTILRKENTENTSKHKKININTNIFINSINKSFLVVVKVCAMIIAFSFFSAPFEYFLSSKFSFILPFVEISKITDITVSPVLAASIFSFGGLCVILQIKAILGNLLNLKVFIIVRIIALSISSALTALFMLTVNNIAIVTNVTLTTSKSYQYGFIPIFICFIMSVMLLYESEKQHLFSKAKK